MIRNVAVRRAVVASFLIPLVLAGCARPQEGSPSAGAAPSGAGEQRVKEAPGSGPECARAAYGIPPGDLKTLKVGFSQSEKEANPFRITETQSLKDEAAKRGITLLATNAQSQLPKQIADIQSLLSQGAQVLVVAPLNSTGLEPALAAARAKNVPVLTIDRTLDGARSCQDYLTTIVSDFVDQGKRAAEAMAEATGGNARVAILLGSSGNNVTTDRTKGFKDYAAANAPGLKVVAEQTGEFQREKGKTVTEQLIQANPGLTAIYAENDEMALGAVAALKAAGKKPGQDIKIVTVDGTREAVQGVVNGEIAAVIESNPRFGPIVFDTYQKFYADTPVPSKIIISDHAYDQGNAAQGLSTAY